MTYSRQFYACAAAERIINMVESAGFDITDPYSIINADWSSFPENMGWGYGASRLVIFDNDECDYVIKIALHEGYEKYCQHEVEVYEAAVKEGFADKFAWCYCYQEPVKEDGIYTPGIYVMEYAECDEDTIADSAWMSGYQNYCEENGYDSTNFDHADEYSEWSEGDEYVILDFVVDSIEDERRRPFWDFLGKWKVTDVHSQNVGFIGTEAVIVDYAGWGWL